MNLGILGPRAVTSQVFLSFKCRTTSQMSGFLTISAIFWRQISALIGSGVALGVMLLFF